MIDAYIVIAIAIAWCIVATIFDFCIREIPDWLNFSLLAITLFASTVYSIIHSTLLIVASLATLAICVMIAYLAYYARIFGGGDAKLMIALGPLLPFIAISKQAQPKQVLNSIAYSTELFFSNLLLIAAIYGLTAMLVLTIKYKKKIVGLIKQDLKKKQNRIVFIVYLLTAMFGLILSIYYLASINYFEFILSLIIFVLPILLVCVKAVDKCMVKSVSVDKLTEGDVLAERIKLGKKVLKPDWQGLSNSEIKLLKKHKIKKVKIKYGIPFAVVFLLALIVSLKMNIMLKIAELISFV